MYTYWAIKPVKSTSMRLLCSSYKTKIYCKFERNISTHHYLETTNVTFSVDTYVNNVQC